MARDIKIRKNDRVECHITNRGFSKLNKWKKSGEKTNGSDIRGNFFTSGKLLVKCTYAQVYIRSVDGIW